MEELITVKLKDKHELYAAWHAVKECVKRRVPDTPSETAFLMEVLGDMAQFDNKEEMTLPEKKMRAIWHCLNVSLLNQFYDSEMQGTKALEIFFTMAKVLDNQGGEDAIKEDWNTSEESEQHSKVEGTSDSLHGEVVQE